MNSSKNSFSNRNSNRGSNFKLEPIPEPAEPEEAVYTFDGEEKTIITADKVFKATTTRDFKTVFELYLTAEDINWINYNNPVLKQFGHLKKLTLAWNKIDRIDNLDALKQLQELDLSHNPISDLANLNLPALTVLKMDGCRIQKLENNFKICKKLQVLSLNDNYISIPSIQGGAQQLLELKELNLGKNKISQIKSIYGYPALEELNLSGNPLKRVHPDAMRELKNLSHLYISDVLLDNEGDALKFLKRLQNLRALRMNRCFDEEASLKDLKALPNLWDLEILELQKVGLISIDEIDRKYPNLMTLDLKFNRIFSMDAISILYELKQLREINFLKNPICVNKSLHDMIMKSAPHIETINRQEIKPPGDTVRQMVEELKEQIKSIRQKPSIKDPETGIEIEKPYQNFDVEEFLKQSDKELELKLNAQSNLEQGINNIAKFKKNQEDLLNKNISDVEKSLFGKKLKKLTKQQNVKEDEDDAEVDDIIRFQTEYKSQYLDIRGEFRNVVDRLRTTEYQTFAKVDLMRKKDDGGAAYKKIDNEKKLIKERLKKLGNEKVMINNLVSDDYDSEDDEEFYKNDNSDTPEKQAEGTIPGSKPGVPVYQGPSLLKTQTVEYKPDFGLPPKQHSERGSSQNSNRDFRIKNNPSASSVAGIQQQQKQKTRGLLMGMHKPHQLSDQNEQIKRMLGMVPTPDPVTKKKNPVSDMLSNASSKKSFSYVSESDGKRSQPVRAHSQIKPPNLRSNSVKKSNVDSDWEIEALEDMMERLDLEENLETYNKRMKKQEEAHKHNFLHRFLENTEKDLKKKESEDIIFKKPSFLRTRGEETKSPVKSPQKPKSILKMAKTDSSAGEGQSMLHFSQMVSKKLVPSEPTTAFDGLAMIRVQGDYQLGSAQAEKPLAFTNLPASANQNLMAFEQQLLMAKKIKDQQASFGLQSDSIKPRYKVAIQPKSSKQK